jgi:hypothetical protein
MTVTILKTREPRVQRLQFDFREDEVKELDLLMVQCNLSNRKELFSNALTLLRWSCRETMKGNTVAAVDEEENQYFVLTMPIFDALRRHANEFSGSDPIEAPPVTAARKKTRRTS